MRATSKGSFILNKSEFLSLIFVAAQCNHSIGFSDTLYTHLEAMSLSLLLSLQSKRTIRVRHIGIQDPQTGNGLVLV